MKLLHLTPKKNISSILKLGLLPQKVKNESHLYQFQHDGLADDKVVYMWDPDTSGSSTDKLIKDFIYCKHFIHPRNNMFDEAEVLGLPDIDFSKLGNKLFGEPEDYILLEIDSKGIDLLNDGYCHGQWVETDDFSTSVAMKSIYEHYDKMLQIATENINKKSFKIINEISTRFYKDNTIGVSYKKNVI